MKLEDIFGIGKKTAHKLRSNNIWTPYDLITTFPKSYENYTVTDFYDAKHQEVITIIGKIVKIDTFTKNINIIKLLIEVDKVLTTAIIFNQAFLLKQLSLNQMVLIKGKYNLYTNEIVVSSISRNIDKRYIVANYKLEGITDHTISVAVNDIITNKKAPIYETLPPKIILDYQLLKREDAIKKIHLPNNSFELKQALQRFKYEEAIKIQLKLQRETLLIPKRESVEYNLDIVKEFISSLPYELTLDQKEAVNDIYKDFKSGNRSRRLIQGDVGSGKTIVAILAALGAITANKQVVFMVPTEILAIQQYENIKQLLPNYNVELLTSKVSGKTEIIKNILKGKTNIVIGTHAVASEGVLFKNLGLIIIDEQHKFGVELRESLINKSETADLIYLTATPIPRTLGISLFGDLKTSIIKSRPQHQKQIISRNILEQDIELVYQAIEEAIENKEHAFIVVPAISSSQKDHSILSLEADLKKRYGENLFILHGELSSDKRSDVIKSFAEAKGAVLLSTSMVEVGIDLKTATIMVVLAAENFGLSQLHQLRGRVGRGEKRGTFYTVSQKEEVERLELLSQTSDGFKLSEFDLKLRGPGDFLGFKQSGIFEAKYLDFGTDYQILKDAKKIANQVLRYNKLGSDSNYYHLNKIIKEE